MQLHQLAYALAVAEEQSFTQAAARLHLAQPSLSRQVRLLEHELGVVLFNRGPGQGPVTLTPDGAALLPFMQRVLADVEATGAEARALSGMARGRLAVGATPSLITSALAPALVAFHASHPGIDLSVVEAGSHQLVPQVAAGEVDLALVVLPVTDPLVVTTPLFDDPLVLATAPDHPFAGRRRVRVRDLDGLDLVMFREGYDLRAVTLSACPEAGVEPHLVSEGAEMAGVLSFVAAGLGAAVVPAIALPADGSLVGIPFAGAHAQPHRRPGPARRPRPGPAGPRPGRPAAGAPPARIRRAVSGVTGLGFVHGRLLLSRPLRDPAARRPQAPRRPPRIHRRPARLGLGVGAGGRGDAAQHRQAASRPATTLVPGVLGFEDTVVPQLENAILAGHDIILLGERGQAKTRVIRSMVGLLDEWMPIIAGSEINDDPYNPVSRYALDRVDELGEATPVAWVHRSQRYGEKLATPDTSIADLIGEVDPIKIAEGRYLSDELALHYGLIPRVNRGIFAINELPDLSERIQVGLLNILEERDVQIRGHRIRLPLDITLVATANPEDYTNRGRIITPLKDRFGAQIRTHYPYETMTEVRIMESEADLPTAGVPVSVPPFMKEVVAEISQLARRSTHLNQRSGVSVRLSIANYETLVASAVRRALRTGEPVAVPRISDLSALVPSTQGKIEVEAMEEGHEDEVVAQLVAAATLAVFRRRVTLDDPQSIVAAFHEQVVVHVGDDLPSSAYLAVLADVPELEPPTRKLAGPEAAEAESPALMASALEFLLEGLHLTKRLNKDASGARALYRGRK